MKRGIQYFRKACLVLTAAALAWLAVSCIFNQDLPGGFNTSYAKGKSSKSKAVTVKNAKKGVKVSSGKYVYKITSASGKKRSVSMTGVSSKGKKVKKVVIPNSIKIRSSTGKNKGTHVYKVTSVGKNAFKGNKKITSVKMGKNVKRIGAGAFWGATLIKRVVIPTGSKLEVIEKNAFRNCYSLSKFNFENAKHLKKIGKNAFKYTSIDEDKLKDIKVKIKVESYTYEVIPMLEPFNSYFFIKTDNPDPESFRFLDVDSVYADENDTDSHGQRTDGFISVRDKEYADVKYENKKTRRVHGGYIARGTGTDGGKLRLQYGYETAYKRISYQAYKDCGKTVEVSKLKNNVDYLIDKYSDSSKNYFDNLSGIQKGFYSECLYSGSYVLGKMEKNTKLPFYGLSTSPHIDQDFYIQSPYFRKDNKNMLVSALYPMKCDSLGFPATMAAIAKKLNSSVIVKQNPYSHADINVTLGGTTKQYGGQGHGMGKGIYESQIKYWYSFDGSNDDACRKVNLTDLKKRILEYGKMDVPEEPTDLPKLTWSSVRNTVGKDGSYVKLQSGVKDLYTFLYDDGSTEEGINGFARIGFFSNAWYDGRYFNLWEEIYSGVTFEETLLDPYPDIVFKDVNIKIPDDGKDYFYNGKPVSDIDNYNPETGVWSGFTTYSYDSSTQTWKNDLIRYLIQCGEEVNYGYYKYYIYKDIEDQDFIDACTITLDEAKSMNLDANTNVTPGNYYIYDRTVPPGTYHSGN